jgi:hypothetical protein
MEAAMAQFYGAVPCALLLTAGLHRAETVGRGGGENQWEDLAVCE